MNSRHAMIAAVGFLSLSGVSVSFGGRPQPAAPVLPPSFVQNQGNPQQNSNSGQQSQPNSGSPSQQSQSNSGTPYNNTNTPQNSGSSQYKAQKNSSNNNQNNNSQTQNRNPYAYPYGYPYGYGQPMYGIYYPSGSPSGTSGNPNGVPQNNANNNNNNAPGLFAPPPVANNIAPAVPAMVAPPTPPDPEVIQATADLNTAMNVLRDTLMKTNPEYQAAVADKKAAQAESAALHASDQPVAPETFLAAATRGLQAATKVTQIERDAAAKDQGVQDAQSKLNTVLAAHAGSK